MDIIRCIFEKGIATGRDYILRYAQDAVNELIRGGCYDLNVTDFVDNYGIMDDWDGVKATFMYTIERIGNEVENAEQLRQLRKDTRGRVVGGGFGVGGAVGGMAAAGILNAVSGLLHSGANAVGNAMTRGAAKSRLEEIYQSTKEDIPGILRDCIIKVGIAKVDAMGYDIEDAEYPTIDSTDRAEKLINNFNIIPLEDRQAVCADIISLDPLSYESYRLALNEFGDRDGTLLELAKALGAINYAMAKSECLMSDLERETDRFMADLARLSLRDYEDKTSDEYLKISISNVKEICTKYGLNDESKNTLEYLGKVEKMLKDRYKVLCKQEEERRTYDGIVYDSYEDCKIAARIWREIESSIKDVDELPPEKIDELIQTVNNMSSEAPQQLKRRVSLLVDRLNDARIKAEVTERTFLDITFETKGEKEGAERAWKELHALSEHALSESNGEERESERIAKAISILRNGMSTINDAHKNMISDEIADLETRYEETDEQERTFLEHIFPTFESSEKARSDYKYLCDTFPPASLATLSNITALDKVLKNGKIDNYIASIYGEKLGKAKRSKMTNSVSAVYRGAGVLAAVLLLVMLIFVPTIIVEGYALNSIHMVQLVFEDGLAVEVRGYFAAFILFIDLPLLFPLLNLFNNEKKKDPWRTIGIVGILMLLVVIGTRAEQAAYATTGFLSVIALIAIAVGFFMKIAVGKKVL